MNFEKYFSHEICKWLQKNGENAENITFIRDKNMFITIKGKILESPYLISKTILDNIVSTMCNGSIYANQYSLKNGYITLPGGNRVGVTGTCVKSEGKVTHLRDITAINIRVAREIKGAAKEIIQYIKTDGRIYNTLIVSPPSSGKTTLLRDIARILGNEYRVGIVDERCEISKEKDVGKYTFVMEECSKSEGIVMLLRAMSPDVILTDEIGTEEDEIVLHKLLNAGVKMICTAHGYDEKDIIRRKVFEKLINGKVFERIIVLSARHGPGTIERIINNR